MSFPDFAPQTKPIESDLEIAIESGKNSIIEESVSNVTSDRPDGGLRAWSVAGGAAAVLFCTFGYANAFGYVFFRKSNDHN